MFQTDVHSTPTAFPATAPFEYHKQATNSNQSFMAPKKRSSSQQPSGDVNSLERLASYVQLASGGEAVSVEQQLEGVTSIHKLLEEDNQAVHAVLAATKSGALLENALSRNDSPALQEQAAIVLNQLLADPELLSEDQLTMLVPRFIALLKDPKTGQRTKDLVVQTIGDIALVSTVFRDWLLKEINVIEPLLGLAGGSEPLGADTLFMLTTTIIKLSNDMPRPPLSYLQPALPLLATLLHHDDSCVVEHAAWAIGCISHGAIDRIQAVLDAGCLPPVKLLSSNDRIVPPVLRIIDDIASGTDQQTSLALRSDGLLASLEKLLAHPLHQKGACHVISNMVANTKEDIIFVLETSTVFSTTIHLLSSNDTSIPVMKEALYIINNSLNPGSPETNNELVALGVIPALCGLLVEGSVDEVVSMSLDALKSMLRFGKHADPTAVVVKEVVKGGFHPLLEALWDHGDHRIYTPAGEIWQAFFDEQTVSMLLRDTRWTWELHSTFPSDTRFAVCAVFEGPTMRDSKGDVQFLPGEVAYQICSFLGEKGYNLPLVQAPLKS